MLMLVRQAQMTALEQAMRDGFRRRLLAHVERVFGAPGGAAAGDAPAAPPNDGRQRLEDLMDQGIALAGRYGIETERDVARVVDVTVQLGPDFPAAPDTHWAHAVLSDHAQAPAARVDELYRRLAADHPEWSHLWHAW